jgi:hypothetical protein
MKSLPVGFQSLDKIITNDFVYVDKTETLYNLVKKPGLYFLSRPRRFGKTLTCSTLESIFQGKKELFAGLAISKKEYDWKQYPVIRLDFNGISHQTHDEIIISLNGFLRDLALTQGVDISQETQPKDMFRKLLTLTAKKHGPVVIIIDEYDKPILDHIYNTETALIMRDFMKSFYGVLKDAEVEANLRFLFVTGVSKFSKVSIFSELNNLQDLTLDDSMATLCGYTQEELEFYFKDHINAYAQKDGITPQALLDQLKLWYNGFCFSKNGEKVYNPFSILNCLQQNDFRNYWFSSGTPMFIVKFAERNPDMVQKLMTFETGELTVNDLEKLSIESYFKNTLVIFQQAGYLTLSSYDNNTKIFSLIYPNYEVRLSMTEHILDYIAQVPSVKIATTEYKLKQALEQDNIDAFCATMKDFFIILPLTVIVNREKFYQGVFFTLAKLIGAKIDAESATSHGFIDAVLEGKKNTYVIEFKRDKTPDIALEQIRNKDYCAKFKIEGTKPVVLVGINFDFKPKSGVTVSWKIAAT